jgi:hypothetical protein
MTTQQDAYDAVIRRVYPDGPPTGEDPADRDLLTATILEAHEAWERADLKVVWGVEPHVFVCHSDIGGCEAPDCGWTHDTPIHVRRLSPWVTQRASSGTAAKARVEPTLGDRIKADRGIA